MIQILIVDDEKPICDLIQMSLTRAGYHCTCVYDGLAAADILERNVFDLILLDVMLPNADGFELMEYIRPLGIPVIFLTARGSVDDRVRGLRMGAEDYIVKPFEVVELLARVDVVLRRYNKTDAVIEIGGLRIDTRAMQVWRGTEEISLTHKEYDLLLFFARNPGTALYRETIYEHVWGGEYSYGSKTVDLRSQVLTPDEQMDAANYIFSEGKRLEALGLKLLDMLSLDQSKLQLVPASPADLVAGLLEHLKRLYAQKGIALQYRTEEGACFLEPDLFKTLLVNLMDNARKALDSGGNIYVWQEMLPDGCRVRVLDNGRGIPPEALAHLTEAFYRVDKSRSRAQGGAGLGLSLCNEIVQLHGGTMQFESRVGNGTVVTVELKGGRV